MPLESILSQIKSIYDQFKVIDFIVFIVAAFIAGAIFASRVRRVLRKEIEPAIRGTLATLTSDAEKFRTELKSSLKTDLNEAIGSFRLEVRKITQGAKDSLKHTSRNFRSGFEANPAEVQRKKDSAENIARRVEDTSTVELLPSIQSIDAADEDELERNRGELQAIWHEVWTWIKSLRKNAISEEPRGVVIGQLTNANMKSPSQLIVMLYRYGWLSDRASDVALELEALFNRHKTKKVPVDNDTISRARTLFDEWTNLPD